MGLSQRQSAAETEFRKRPSDSLYVTSQKAHIYPLLLPSRHIWTSTSANRGIIALVKSTTLTNLSFPGTPATIRGDIAANHHGTLRFNSDHLYVRWNIRTGIIAPLLKIFYNTFQSYFKFVYFRSFFRRRSCIGLALADIMKKLKASKPNCKSEEKHFAGTAS